MHDDVGVTHMINLIGYSFVWFKINPSYDMFYKPKNRAQTRVSVLKWYDSGPTHGNLKRIYGIKLSVCYYFLKANIQWISELKEFFA